MDEKLQEQVNSGSTEDQCPGLRLVHPLEDGPTKDCEGHDEAPIEGAKERMTHFEKWFLQVPRPPGFASTRSILSKERRPCKPTFRPLAEEVETRHGI